MKKQQTIDRPFEIKSVSENGAFEGYASVFGELDAYRDIVVAGAFNKSLQEDFLSKNRKVPMLWQHDDADPIGIYPVLHEDSKGLFVQGACNMEVQQGRECHALMTQGALTGLSIGYNTIDADWDDQNHARILKTLKLWEISPVTFPAGDEARVSQVKSIAEMTSLSEAEEYLRDAGFSRKEAVAFMSRTKAMLTQSDSADAEAKAVKKMLETLSQIHFGVEK